MTKRFGFIFILLFLTASQISFSQNRAEKDSLVRLLDASSAQQLEESGMSFRRILGPGARFLHNNTYLICDSASWNVTVKYIEAFGNVKIIQDNTMLMSESMVYLIDQNTAKFQGQVVELLDKAGNKLRTRQLDYNTKDSVASFSYGAAMKDTSGNVIESKRGSYDSKASTFTFEDEVEMYNDSIFIKTNTLKYRSDLEKAFFGTNTYMWRGTGFMNADAGWYDRRNDIVYFNDNAYMNDKDYEIWSDEIYYKKSQGIVEMYNNVQILDTANTAILLAHDAKYYRDSLMAVLTKDPAIVYYGENEKHEPDSAFIRADSLFCYSVEKWTIPQKEIEDAKKRKEDALFDALAEIRAKQAEERKKAAEEKMRESGKLPPVIAKDSLGVAQDSTGVVSDSLGVAADSLAVADDSLISPTSAQDSSKIVATDSLTVAAAIHNADTSQVSGTKDAVAVSDSLTTSHEKTSIPAVRDSIRPVVDSLAAVRDTTAVPDSIDRSKLDTTLVRHLKAYYNVKLYRSDLQAACDSMIFTELDSMARLYERPVLWNEIKNQLTSEEMQLLIKDGALYRGSMLNSAMITTKEDSTHYNQIKSTEMVGFFADNQLYRYDALGGVTAVYYMVEEEQITTINMKEAKSLTAVIKDGNAQKMLYLEEVKSDAYPIGELAPDKQKLKGFEWRGADRPVDRNAITTRSIYPTQRDKYTDIHKPVYIHTNFYFDHYMDTVYKRIEERAAIERQRQIDSVKKAAFEDMKAQNRLRDSLNIISDSLGLSLDSLYTANGISLRDSLGTDHVVKDSLKMEALNEDRDSTKYNQGVDIEKEAVGTSQSISKPHKLTCREKWKMRKAKRALLRKQRALLKANKS